MAGAIAQGFSEEKTLVSNTPTALNGSITTTTGSTFVCAIRDYSAGISAVTDNFSNTYTQIGSTIAVGSNSLTVWICVNGTGGASHRPTITKTSGDLLSASFFEVTGIVTSSATDGTTGSGLDASSPFNATVTTANATDLVITIGASNGGAATITYTPGAGFTLAGGGTTYATGTNGLSIGVMSQHVVATGTYGGNFTQSSGTSAGVITFALKDAGAATATATPGVGAVTASGLAPTSNAFTNVRIREVLINEAGSPVANQTGIHLVVWYNGFPIGAPDLSYSNMTTDPTGTTSWSLATGTLIYNQRIFYVAHDGHASLSVYTCAQMQPTYT
jgi:hypothetical protein